jgi:phosphoserine phosphatase
VTNAANPGTGRNSAEFAEAVRRVQPKIATFDCDGTLWFGDAGEGFFDWELRQGLVADELVRWARDRYSAYKSGRVDEDTMCGEMVTLHRGLSEAEVQRAATNYFDQHFVSQIFPEMRDLVDQLQQAGCEVWAVSSTNEWIIRAAMKHFDIPEQRVLAASVRVVDGVITDSLVRVPSGAGKPKAIQEAIHRAPDAAFGNSVWDAAMLGVARHAFVVNPTPELEKIGRQRKWTIYYPDPPRSSAHS